MNRIEPLPVIAREGNKLLCTKFLFEVLSICRCYMLLLYFSMVTTLFSMHYEKSAENLFSLKCQ